MLTVNAETLVEDLARVRDQARSRPVTILSRGEPVGAFLSLQDLENYERLKGREQRSYVAGAIPDDVIEAIERAEYMKPAC